VGIREPVKPAIRPTARSRPSERTVFRTSPALIFTYPPVIRSKRTLNHFPNRAIRPVCPCFDFSSIAESAGLSVRALNAEISTEMAMVSANCW
jgi:hypothetical protein